MLQLKVSLTPLSTAPAAMLQLDPALDDDICVTVAPVSPAGKTIVSVTMTPAAVDGPLLRNEIT